MKLTRLNVVYSNDQPVWPLSCFNAPTRGWGGGGGYLDLPLSVRAFSFVLHVALKMLDLESTNFTGMLSSM
jgi:hypothetical protein